MLTQIKEYYEPCPKDQLLKAMAEVNEARRQFEQANRRLEKAVMDLDDVVREQKLV